MVAATSSQRRVLGEVFRGLRVQANVIGALIMREIHTRYGRKGLGFVWIIGEPMILALLVMSIRGTHAARGHNSMDPLVFIVLGYTMYMLFRSLWNRADGALESNMTLLYHRMVTIFDILFARGILDAFGAVGAFLVIVTVLIIMGIADFPARPMDFVIGILLLFWWSFSLSMIICAASYENTVVQKFVHPISYILLPLSGAFFAAEWFPYSVHQYLEWWPMLIIFEEIRYGWFVGASDKFCFIGYTSLVCMVLTFIGLQSIRSVRNRIHL